MCCAGHHKKIFIHAHTYRVWFKSLSTVIDLRFRFSKCSSFLSVTMRSESPSQDDRSSEQHQHTWMYFAGDAAPTDVETEFKKGIRGESNEVVLVEHRIRDAWGAIKYTECLLRGGGVSDTAPVSRLIAMSGEEKTILLDTQVQRFGDTGNVSMNILDLQSVDKYAGKGMILEFHEALLGQLTPESLAQLSGTTLWADDLPLGDAAALAHVLTLVQHLDAVKLGTLDLASAFDIPIVKNPVDHPTVQFRPKARPELQQVIVDFLTAALSKNAALKVILELDAPLEFFCVNGVPISQLFIQGGPDGARAFMRVPRARAAAHETRDLLS